MHMSGRVEYVNRRRDSTSDWYFAVIISCSRLLSVVLGMSSIV
jgi:hypothetical protein